MKQSPRSQRVAGLLQRELSQLIQREISVPGSGGLITVTHVQVSTDLAIAKAYITCLPDDAEQKKAVLTHLADKAAFLRGLCAKRVELRIMPELKFVYDEALAYGNRMTDLINTAVDNDSSDKE